MFGNLVCMLFQKYEYACNYTLKRIKYGIKTTFFVYNFILFLVLITFYFNTLIVVLIL